LIVEVNTISFALIFNLNRNFGVVGVQSPIEPEGEDWPAGQPFVKALYAWVMFRAHSFAQL